MRIRIYATVGRSSVCLSRHLHAAALGLLLAAAAAARRYQAVVALPACSSKCTQYYIVSRRK